MRWLVSVLIAALVLFASLPAEAQVEAAGPFAAAQRWLVLPTVDLSPGAADARASTDAAPRIEALHGTAEALRQELTLRGFSVWQADRASERFEVLGSAPAPEVSQSDIDMWVERSRAAVRYLARADYKAARRELKAAQRLADRAAAELNREAARAQQVLDTCLFMVRAYVETKNDAQARRQARECRHLVPRVEPSAFRHTPEVRELLAEVDQQMASEAPGQLEVQSTPPDCLLRINGVDFGRTPVSRIELPTGMYRVQVECEASERGRIHRVSIQSGANTILFDGELERAVRTQPVLHLQYGAREPEAERMAQAQKVAAVLGGADVLMLSAADRETLRIDLGAEGMAPASTWLPLRDGVAGSDDIRRAIDALLEGRSVDFTGPHPIARASWQAEAEPPLPVDAAAAAVTQADPERARSVPRPREQRIAGWSLFGLGVASIGASVGLHVWRGTLGDEFIDSPNDLSAAQRWNDMRIGVWTTAALGGAAASAAMPLFLPDEERTPWWGWTVGALGLGLSGYAIYEGVTMTACPEPYIANSSAVESCVARGQEAGRLSLALAGAAPLLSVPLVYLFRPLRTQPSVTVKRKGAMVQIRKTF
jgi:hypothetical protein